MIPGSPVATVNRDRDPLAVAGRANTLRVEPHRHAIGLEDLLHSLRDVVVVATNQAVAHLHDRDPTAKPPIHLRKLEPDVAATDNNKVLGQDVDVHHARIREEVDCIEAGHRLEWHVSTPADVNEDLLGLKHIVSGPHEVRAFEPTVSLVHREVLRSPEPGLDTRVGPPHDGVLAGLDRGHVDTHPVADHAEVGTPTRHIGHSGARNERLRGNATRVHAGPSETPTLDYGYPTSSLRQVNRQTWTRLSRSDHDRVIRRLRTWTNVLY